MRIVPHPITLRQIDAPQPNWLLALLCLAIPAFLLTQLTRAAMYSPVLTALISSNSNAYRIAFFFVQAGLTCAAFIFLGWKYAPALWTPQPPGKIQSLLPLLILLPLLLFNLCEAFFSIRAMIILATLFEGREAVQTIGSTYFNIWEPLAYGSSLSGVFCSSLSSFTAPLLEETVFTGLLINAIAKKRGLVAAVAGSSLCFALFHTVQFGFGMHLLPLLFASLSYALIRVLGGSLLLAVFAHCLVNAVIFLPKWLIAAIFVKQLWPA